MFDRAEYNRQYYAELKKEPAAYEAYLKLQRDKKHKRTIKRQDKRILEAAIRMATYDCTVFRPHPSMTFVWSWEKQHDKQVYIELATIALYPERLEQHKND